MSLVTVQGASAGATVKVTIDGGQAVNLAQIVSQFSNDVTADMKNGSMNGDFLSDGADYEHSGNQSGYGMMTTGGSYQVGGNIKYLSVGAMTDNTDFFARVNARNVNGSVSVVAGTNQGVFFEGGSGGGKFTATNGDNTFIANGGQWNIHTSDGNDTIVSGSGNNYIDAGGGSNSIFLNGDSNQVASRGQDTISAAYNTKGDRITIFGGSSMINIGSDAYVNDISGGNTINIQSGMIISDQNNTINIAGQGTVSGGYNDSIVINQGLVDNVVDDKIIGHGNIIVKDATESYVMNTGGRTDFIDGNKTSTVVGSNATVVGSYGLSAHLDGDNSTIIGGYNDTISALGDATVFGATDANVTNSGNLTFIGGVGNATVTGNNTTVFGNNDLSVLMNQTQAYDSTHEGLFVACSGNETIDGSKSQYGIHAFGNNNGVSGSQVMIGGSGSDTLVAGAGDATMTGGTGEGNCFAFRDGIAGANYVITDFSSSAGNYVGLLWYDEKGLDMSLDNQVHTSAGTSITLSDGSKIMFDGVDALTKNDFQWYDKS